MEHSKLVYVASALALSTAIVLAWAVTHPCDCEKSEESE